MRRMSEDVWLSAGIFAVWGALALVYALVPAFDMPGSVLVWGAGAVLFLVLAAVLIVAERRGHGRSRG